MDLVIKLAIGIIILIVIGGLYLLIGLAMVIVLMAKYIIDHRKAKLQKGKNKIKVTETSNNHIFKYHGK